MNKVYDICLFCIFTFFYAGIVHFAGTTQGDAGLLCREPLKYPVFLQSVVPLYLSVVQSFHQKCPHSEFRIPNRSCELAVPIVQDELTRLKIAAKFNPGNGKFIWPPKV